HAYSASDVSVELYNSSQNPNDNPGPAVKFTVPTVVNGKVFVGTQNQLTVFGLQLSISGYITTPRGRPLSGIRVTLLDANDGKWTAVSDSSGYYSSPLGLKSAYYYVQPSDPTYYLSPSGQLIQLGRNSVHGVNFVASPTISGYVQRADGSPLAGIQVNFYDCCGGLWTAATDTTGFYRSPPTMPYGTLYYFQPKDPDNVFSPYGYLLQLGDTPQAGKTFIAH
ncbi:MAG TPA: hypothetical protein VEI74_08585, partial [Candidatus Methylomirabilis sp.]|nr:hypothetical protein [Candidatus Methylomirabilis sp.]